ncbi:Med11p [Cyberlindnera jadinii NRRL Y-1542]|uniref:Mediator of RNA polymerase II transcription subunit 11 n=1 Tax=Cyberlindnera jadinii (strain ATCC 18201 / CBS 1600 / BCRC 20928 / JCM 3617 / NBRC 0987 / NRRL Y-1542) TaxID=983966 RepID=A0A1E4S0G0_CYBJN|nr:mediator of RNA polymerase II transcription subunit 11 [Cyberlindnera jadinii NRRL Y-1542]ODV72967.1 mediator of RNA polymerase II transcription subunit 11 [Cyberlindnera jadinii NRRL Y-1542]
MASEEQDPFVQERLESLHNVDTELVSILNHASLALSSLTSMKRNASDKEELEKIKQEFAREIDGFYKNLEQSTIGLKKEIKILDERIGKTDANGITMSPITISKKATWAGSEKLKSELDHIDSLLD